MRYRWVLNQLLTGRGHIVGSTIQQVEKLNPPNNQVNQQDSYMTTEDDSQHNAARLISNQESPRAVLSASGYLLWLSMWSKSKVPNAPDRARRAPCC